MMKKLTISQYLKRSDAYPVSRATVRSYIEKGILAGEKITTENKSTYFVHIHNEVIDDEFNTILTG
jgi:hypothetical protein